jgi:hypothetical protein
MHIRANGPSAERHNLFGRRVSASLLSQGDAYDLTGSYIRGGAGSVVAVTTVELGPSVPLLRMTVTL